MTDNAEKKYYIKISGIHKTTPKVLIQEHTMHKIIFETALILLLITKITLSMDTVTRLETARGSFASAIYEHKIHDKYYIEKTFKEQKELNDELRKVLALQEPLKEYILEKTSDMPSFALYQKHGYNSITYEKAKGEPLWDFLIRAAITEIDFSITGDGFYNANTRSVMKNLRKVGYSIAKFHIWFRKSNDDDTFLSCVHGDMSPSNVFFNLYDGVVTFIDYSTFSYPEKKDVIIDIDKFFNPYKAIGSDLKYGIMETLHNKHLYGNAFDRKYQASLQRLQKLKRVMAEGYNDALKEARMGYMLSENKQGKFILEKVTF